MKEFVTKRILRKFIISFIWLLIPFDIVVVPIMLEAKFEAENKLTPYSVHVNGYERADGSYVESYSRRPPGSVSHDRPIERKISELFWGVFLLITATILCFFAFLYHAFDEYSNREKNYKLHVESSIKNSITLDITILKNKPKYLINRHISRYDYNKVYKCRLCKRSIKKFEFHSSSLASRNPTKTCIDCMKLDEANYKIALEYIENFESLMKLYLQEFQIINNTLHPDSIIKLDRIKDLFYSHVKETRFNNK